MFNTRQSDLFVSQNIIYCCKIIIVVVIYCYYYHSIHIYYHNNSYITIYRIFPNGLLDATPPDPLHGGQDGCGARGLGFVARPFLFPKNLVVGRTICTGNSDITVIYYSNSWKFIWMGWFSIVANCYGIAHGIQRWNIAQDLLVIVAGRLSIAMFDVTTLAQQYMIHVPRAC